VTPESARMGEGVMEHKRAGMEESSSSSSSSESSDSNALKGLGWEKRDVGVGGIIVGRSGNVVWGRGEVALKVVKELTRTVGREVGRLSSVPGGMCGGGANREVGRVLIPRGVGGVGGVGGMGGETHSETGRGEGGHIGALDGQLTWQG
jgi:hypothetical protein